MPASRQEELYVTLDNAVRYGINQSLLSGLQPGVFDGLAGAASREVDRYLALTGAQVPLQDPDDDIRSKTADILRLKLLFQRGFDPSTNVHESAQEAHDRALAALQKMADQALEFKDDDGEHKVPITRLAVY